MSGDHEAIPMGWMDDIGMKSLMYVGIIALLFMAGYMWMQNEKWKLPTFTRSVSAGAAPAPAEAEASDEG